MTALVTVADLDAAQDRIRAAGATPVTFVGGPARDSNWRKLAFYVSAHFDGMYVIGTGSTLDSAVTDLLTQGKARTPKGEVVQLALGMPA